MARLTSSKRNSLKSSSFALPGRRYPINDRTHAANAKSRVAQNGTPAEKKAVAAAVSKKFPGLGKTKTAKSSKTANKGSKSKK